MYFESFATAWDMDGHGIYVWSAYFVSLVVLLYLIWSPLRRRRLVIKQVSAELRRAQALAERTGE